MRELGIAAGLLLLFVGVGLGQAVPWPNLMAAGYRTMMSAAAVGVPLEALYFLLLALALRGHPARPPRWYMRSFEHHHLLTSVQRRWVLPPFYLGALSFVIIVLGIALVGIAGAAAVM